MPGEGPKPFPWLRTWWSSPGKENLTEGFSEAENSWNKPLGLAHAFQCPYYLGPLTSNQEQMGSVSPCPSTFSAMVITSSVTSHHFQGNMLPSRAPPKQQAQTKEGRRNTWLLETWTPLQTWAEQPPWCLDTNTPTARSQQRGGNWRNLNPDWVFEIVSHYC